MKLIKYLLLASLMFMFGCDPPESRNTQTNTKELPQPIHNYKLELKENEIYINFATDKYEEYIITKDTITNIVYIQQRNSGFPRIAIIPNGTKYEND